MVFFKENGGCNFAGEKGIERLKIWGGWILNFVWESVLLKIKVGFGIFVFMEVNWFVVLVEYFMVLFSYLFKML